MPKQLSEEVSEVVKQAIAETGTQTKADRGKVRSAVIPKVKGEAEDSLVNKLVKQHIS